MNALQNMNTCNKGCWIAALGCGVVAFLLMLSLTNFVAGVLFAAGMTFFMGLVLTLLFCDEGQARLSKVAAPSAAPKDTASKAAAESAPEPATPTKPAPKPEAEAAPADETGAMLQAPEGGTADDLKVLKGVGPKLEQTLNNLGVFHYHQIAAWTEADVEWVDSRLKFKGRIKRDGWIAQAKDLAGN